MAPKSPTKTLPEILPEMLPEEIQRYITANFDEVYPLESWGEKSFWG